MTQADEQLRRRLREMDESEIREKVRRDLFGGPGHRHRAIAEAHLETRTAEQEAQHRTKVEALAKATNEHAAEANRIAKSARSWSAVAACVAILAAVLAVIALLR